jgi:TolB-like protein
MGVTVSNPTTWFALVTFACAADVAHAVPASSPAATPRPNVAIFSLEPKTGVPPATAEALTENFVEEVRSCDAFGRVVSDKEIEAVIGLERQRQLVDCGSGSCMAELAGSLGVDLIIRGSLAKFGNSYLFNVKAIDTRSGVAVAAVSERVRGDSEEALLDVIPHAAFQLAKQAGLSPRPIPLRESAPTGQPQPAPSAPSSPGTLKNARTPTPADVGPATAPSPTTPTTAGGDAKPWLAGGMAAVLLGGVSAVVSMAFGGTAVALLILALYVPMTFLGPVGLAFIPYYAREVGVLSLVVVVAGAGVLAGLLAATAGAVGTVSVGRGFLLE